MTLDLINNAALLLAICWLQSLISNRWDKSRLKAQLLSGLLFSSAAIAVMMTSILIQPGLWLWTDSGMVVIGVSTLCYGPIAGGLATLTGVIYKFWIGGLAATGGIASLLLSFTIGLGLYALFRKLKQEPDWRTFLVFGFLVHALGAWQLFYFHLPVEPEIWQPYMLTLLMIMTPTTVLLGLQLQFIERKNALEKQIQQNENRLKLITQSIPDELIIANRDGSLADAITPASLAEALKSRIGRPIADIDRDAFATHYEYLIAKTLKTGQAQTDTYSAPRVHLLGQKTEGAVFHFESRANPISDGAEADEVVILTRDITERVQAEAEIQYLAHFDPLTDLANRHKLELTIDRYIDEFDATGDRLFVTLFYLNDFNLYNQSLGAEAGDFLLSELARRLNQAFGDSYMIARYSGLEFAILQVDSQSRDSNSELCQRIQQTVQVPVKYKDALLKITTSIGTAGYPADGSDSGEILRKASLALQSARSGEADRIAHYDASMDARFQQKLKIRQHLTCAVENGELEIYFQPIHHLADAGLAGVEALIRWSHPELGVQDPGFFLETAEKSGLIASIGAWSIEQACTRAVDMADKGINPATISVNISLIQLADCEFPRLVQGLLARTGLNPDQLLLEISEPEIIKNLETIHQTAALLREMGVRLAIDNFGSGFTNLKLIKELGVEMVKIDRSYVLALQDQPEQVAMVEALIQIARSLQVKTVAVGVEDDACRQQLLDLGIDMGQGYYYARPQPYDALLKTIAGGR